MEEKKSTKHSFSSFLLILSIIVIAIMGAFIYKLYNEKNEEIQKSEELQTQVNDLNSSLSELQEKLDIISNTINSGSSEKNKTANDQKESKESNSGTSSSSSSSSSNKSATAKKKDTSSLIVGSWEASKVVDTNGNDLGLSSYWGSGISSSNEMIFEEDGTLKYMIGITASSDDGQYTISGNTIRYGIPTDIKGRYNWSTLTYDSEKDVLKEEVDDYDGEKIITYVRK